MLSQVVADKNRSLSCVYVSRTQVIWQPISAYEVRDAYFRFQNLRQLARHFGISPLLVRKLLRLTHIDYIRDLYNAYKGGCSCEELAKQNGMKPSTLSKLFKNSRLKVYPRHSRPKITRKKALAIWRWTGTINSFARKMGIHWQTALSLHEVLDLPPPKPPPNRLGRPPSHLRAPVQSTELGSIDIF